VYGTWTGESCLRWSSRVHSTLVYPCALDQRRPCTRLDQRRQDSPVHVSYTQYFRKPVVIHRKLETVN